MDTGAYPLYVRMLYRYDSAEGAMAFPFSGPCFCSGIYISLPPSSFNMALISYLVACFCCI
jgi:hypothetical protein